MRKLRRVAQLSRERGYTEPQCRWWVFQADSNGLAAMGAIVRIGRTVWIDEDRFDAWLDSKVSGPGGAL
ncbi:hypothetical protein GCM10027193_05510 [Arenimonas aestuarii]